MDKFEMYFAKPSGFSVNTGVLRRPVVTWNSDGFTLQAHQVQTQRGPVKVEVLVSPDPLSGRTSLNISAPAPRDAIKEFLGFHRVKLGDDTLDKSLRIVGRVPAAVRALLTQPSVRRGVIAVFSAQPMGAEIHIEDDVMRVVRPSAAGTPESMHRLMQQAKRLAVALRENRDVPQMTALSVSDSAGLGAAGGSPMAVPVSVKRRREKP